MAEVQVRDARKAYGAHDKIPAVQQDMRAVIDAAEGTPRRMVGAERLAFCDLAKNAYAVVQTGERRFYGCFMLRKGVVPPDA